MNSKTDVIKKLSRRTLRGEGLLKYAKMDLLQGLWAASYVCRERDRIEGFQSAVEYYNNAFNIHIEEFGEQRKNYQYIGSQCNPFVVLEMGKSFDNTKIYNRPDFNFYSSFCAVHRKAIEIFYSSDRYEYSKFLVNVEEGFVKENDEGNIFPPPKNYSLIKQALDLFPDTFMPVFDLEKKIHQFDLFSLLSVLSNRDYIFHILDSVEGFDKFELLKVELLELIANYKEVDSRKKYYDFCSEFLSVLEDKGCKEKSVKDFLNAKYDDNEDYILAFSNYISFKEDTFALQFYEDSRSLMGSRGAKFNDRFRNQFNQLKLSLTNEGKTVKVEFPNDIEDDVDVDAVIGAMRKIFNEVSDNTRNDRKYDLCHYMEKEKEKIEFFNYNGPFNWLGGAFSEYMEWLNKIVSKDFLTNLNVSEKDVVRGSKVIINMLCPEEWRCKDFGNITDVYEYVAKTERLEGDWEYGGFAFPVMGGGDKNKPGRLVSCLELSKFRYKPVSKDVTKTAVKSSYHRLTSSLSNADIEKELNEFTNHCKSVMDSQIFHHVSLPSIFRY